MKAQENRIRRVFHQACMDNRSCTTTMVAAVTLSLAVLTRRRKHFPWSLLRWWVAHRCPGSIPCWLQVRFINKAELMNDLLNPYLPHYLPVSFSNFFYFHPTIHCHKSACKSVEFDIHAAASRSLLSSGAFRLQAYNLALCRVK